jgi:hypothetical protein
MQGRSPAIRFMVLARFVARFRASSKHGFDHTGLLRSRWGLPHGKSGRADSHDLRANSYPYARTC